jgi:hypothetical protein
LDASRQIVLGGLWQLSGSSALNDFVMRISNGDGIFTDGFDPAL